MKEDFPKRLKYLMDLMKISNIKLCEKVGMTYDNLMRWNRGKSFPGPENLKALAKVLKTTESYLLYGIEEQHKSGGEDDKMSIKLLEKQLERKEKELLEAHKRIWELEAQLKAGVVSTSKKL